MSATTIIQNRQIQAAGGHANPLVQGARTPILLSSGMVGIAQGGVSIPNMQQLIPPYRAPYIIREIRFTAQSPQSTGLSFVNTDLQQFLLVQLALGENAITKNFIPICSFCPAVQLRAESAYGGTSYYGTTACRDYAMFRWVLPRPMYVQAGNGIQGSFQRQANDGTTAGYTGNAYLEMSIVGEILPAGTKPPAYSCIPYVAAYQNFKAGFSNSQAFDLPNPWPDRDWNVQRLIGRYYTQLSSGGQVISSVSPDISTTSMNVILTDQDRFPITPAAGVRFTEAFDARTKTLEHRAIIPPKGWIQVNFSPPSTSTESNNVYWISAIGWRKEALT